MKTKSICFIITIVGVLSIIISQVYIKMDESKKLEHLEYVKDRFVSVAKKCINEGACKSNNVTISDLVEKNYITTDLLNELQDYSMNSYVVKNTYKVYLIEKLDN